MNFYLKVSLKRPIIQYATIQLLEKSKQKLSVHNNSTKSIMQQHQIPIQFSNTDQMNIHMNNDNEVHL